MSAYLIVDVEDLLSILKSRSHNADFYQIAARLRMTAALAAGLFDNNALQSVAVADWEKLSSLGNGALQNAFTTAGYEIVDMPDRRSIADALHMQYFSANPDAVDELIIVTSSTDLTPLIQRIRLTRDARVRIWAQQAPAISGVIFQPIDAILGIQEKSVALYIDFENIAISLMQNKFVVNIDRLIDAMVSHAGSYGQVKKMAAYAPWGQRGGLPPLVDDMGTESSDAAPSKLAMANIDPVYNLPGKNSADMRIARDVLNDSSAPNSPDVYIIASGDRDFNELFMNLRQRGKTVVVWGVQGSTSAVVANNPNVKLEYVDNFAGLSRQEALNNSLGQPALMPNGAVIAFNPSQFSTLVIQYDRLTETVPPGAPITESMLQEQLRVTNAVTTPQRAKELVEQAVAMNIMRRYRLPELGAIDCVRPVDDHSIVERTRLVRDRIASRVENTLDVRDWMYVNYGFLLRGIAMDHELLKPGLNIDDSWRSLWVDALVREGILQREMVPHRMNPDDLVPVIRLPPRTLRPVSVVLDDDMMLSLEAIPDDDGVMTIETQQMIKRVITSVDQFTSYRGFTWCPLRSLHMRMKDVDSGMTFQRAVEHLAELGAVVIDSYMNPQSEYRTKGISLVIESPIVQNVLLERDRVINALLDLYDERVPINFMTLIDRIGVSDQDTTMWLALMVDENVLNPVAGKPGVYTLFRTHHTVNQVAERRAAALGIQVFAPPDPADIQPTQANNPDYFSDSMAHFAELDGVATSASDHMSDSAALDGSRHSAEGAFQLALSQPQSEPATSEPVVNDNMPDDPPVPVKRPRKPRTPKTTIQPEN